ncbi:hypothetical protein ABIF97_004147 [Bradyrhizobium japonicum]
MQTRLGGCNRAAGDARRSCHAPSGTRSARQAPVLSRNVAPQGAQTPLTVVVAMIDRSVFLREVSHWLDHRILSSPRCSFGALSGGFSTPFGSCRSSIGPRNDRAGWTYHRHADGHCRSRAMGAPCHHTNKNAACLNDRKRRFSSPERVKQNPGRDQSVRMRLKFNHRAEQEGRQLKAALPFEAPALQQSLGLERRNDRADYSDPGHRHQ